MKIAERLIARWGKCGLATITSETADSLELPQHAGRFLHDTGLPWDAPAAAVGILFSLDVEDERLCLTPYWQGSSEYLCFGDSGSSRLAVSCDDGTVVLVDPESQSSPMFVNSGIEEFAGFLHLYEVSTGTVRDDDPVGFIEAVDRYRDEYRRIDPHALSDRGKWWSMILEDMRY